MRPRPKRPKFPGKFFSWNVTISTDWQRRTSEHFLVFSSGKREAVLRYLWLKYVWNNLTQEEFLVLILSLKDSDDKKWSFIRATQTIKRSVLRERLLAKERTQEEVLSSRISYLGSRRLRIEIHRWTRKLPNVPKYSGYVRSIASLGKNKPRDLGLTIEELMTDGVVMEERFDWFHFLTVGD